MRLTEASMLKAKNTWTIKAIQMNIHMPKKELKLKWALKPMFYPVSFELKLLPK